VCFLNVCNHFLTVGSDFLNVNPDFRPVVASCLIVGSDFPKVDVRCPNVRGDSSAVNFVRRNVGCDCVTVENYSKNSLRGFGCLHIFSVPLSQWKIIISV
jgi:hypothetical protein